MTCDETRDRFSDLVDDRLAAHERAAVDAHLATCAVCPTELERFRATVALLRSLEPARAPVGFVDRVVAASRPRPWWRRLAAHALYPLPVKLPLEAAAILLVGVGVAYLFQRTPELQEAARVDAPVVERRASPPPPAPPAPSEPEPTQPRQPKATAPAPSPPASEDATRSQPGAPTELRAERARPDADARGRASRDEPMRELGDSKRRAEGAPEPVPQVAESKREAARAPTPETRTKTESAPALQRAPSTVSPSAEPAPSAPPPADVQAPRAMAKAAPFDAAGTLAVSARPAAEDAVRELVTRHRGQVVVSRIEPAATAVEITMPGAEYPRFAAGLAALGRWQPEREPAEIRPEIRVLLRLVE